MTSQKTNPAGDATGVSSHLSVMELLTAYSIFGNDGVNPNSGRQVISSETSRAVLEMLENAVEGQGATGARAHVDGIAVCGKTGTTQQEGTAGRTATFVGLVPVQQPRWAIAVAVDGTSSEAFGGSVAAPAFASIVEQALQ